MAVVLENEINKLIATRRRILCFLDCKIWKVNTLKEVVALVLYKSQVISLA